MMARLNALDLLPEEAKVFFQDGKDGFILVHPLPPDQCHPIQHEKHHNHHYDLHQMNDIEPFILRCHIPLFQLTLGPTWPQLDS